MTFDEGSDLSAGVWVTKTWTNAMRVCYACVLGENGEFDSLMVGDLWADATAPWNVAIQLQQLTSRFS